MPLSERGADKERSGVALDEDINEADRLVDDDDDALPIVERDANEEVEALTVWCNVVEGEEDRESP